MHVPSLELQVGVVGESGLKLQVCVGKESGLKFAAMRVVPLRFRSISLQGRSQFRFKCLQPCSSVLFSNLSVVHHCGMGSWSEHMFEVANGEDCTSKHISARGKSVSNVCSHVLHCCFVRSCQLCNKLKHFLLRSCSPSSMPSMIDGRRWRHSTQLLPLTR